jgi:hypothetical protein
MNRVVNIHLFLIKKKVYLPVNRVAPQWFPSNWLHVTQHCPLIEECILRVCLVAWVIAESLSHLRYSHLIQVTLRFLHVFGSSWVFTRVVSRHCLVACIRWDMSLFSFFTHETLCPKVNYNQVQLEMIRPNLPNNKLLVELGWSENIWVQPAYQTHP